MLHTLNDSPWQRDITAALRLVKEGDDLLLLSDGVIAALENNRFLELLLAAPITLYALKVDVDARGVSAQISRSVISVSYTDFVRLTVKHSSQLAW